MSDYEEYDEGTREFQDEFNREFTHRATPTIREIIHIKSALREEVRQLIDRRGGILDAEKLKEHKVLLYHSQLRLAYWEDVLKEQEPEPDPLLAQAKEQARFDTLLGEETTEQ